VQAFFSGGTLHDQIVGDLALPIDIANLAPTNREKLPSEACRCPARNSLREEVPGQQFDHGHDRTSPSCHSSIAITMDIYSHLMPNMQGEAAAAVDVAMRAAINNPKDIG
jgi:hypothetical protein